MKNKLGFIDALRGLSILLVMIVHTGQETTVYHAHWIHAVTAAGSKGVQLFFIASAFTLFLSWHNEQKKREPSVLSFYLRRFFRIAPMYYLGILYYLWQQGYWEENLHQITAGNIAANFLFVHGLLPDWINSLVPGGWSISIEMMFYLFIPFFILKITSLNKAFWWLGASILFNLVLEKLLWYSAVPHNETGAGFLYFFLPNQLPVFICGIASYYMVMKRDFTVSKTAVAFLLSALVLVIFYGHILTDPLLAGLIFMSFPVILERMKPKLIVNRFFMYLGKISYSCYLVHFGVVYFLTKYGISNLVPGTSAPAAVLNLFVNLGMVILLTSMIATACYHWVETPMQHLGRKIIRYRENRRRSMDEDPKYQLEIVSQGAVEQNGVG